MAVRAFTDKPEALVDSDAKCNPVDSIGSSTKSRLPIPNAGLLLGFQGTKTALREGISSAFSDAGGCTSPRNSGGCPPRRQETSTALPGPSRSFAAIVRRQMCDRLGRLRRRTWPPDNYADRQRYWRGFASISLSLMATPSGRGTTPACSFSISDVRN